MRDTIIILIACIIAGSVGAGFYFMAGPGHATPVAATNSAVAAGVAGTSQPIDILLRQNDAPQGIGKVNYLITNSDDLTKLWMMIFGANGEAPPNVDFSKSEVLAVFDGSHSTGGFSISVEAVKDSSNGRTVIVQRESPGSNCSVTQGLTAPYEVVVVPKTTLPISHVDDPVTDVCN